MAQFSQIQINMNQNRISRRYASRSTKASINRCPRQALPIVFRIASKEAVGGQRFGYRNVIDRHRHDYFATPLSLTITR
jgi:hypothetical protein